MEEKIKIRHAIEKDIPIIKSLLVQVCNVHNEIRPDLFAKDGNKYNESELAEIIADENRPILAAVDEKDVMLGYAFCVLKTFAGSESTGIKTLYIDDLCVDKSKRGQHIGKALFEAAKRLAKENGCYNITLNVWEGNDSAYSFYKAQKMRTQKTGMEFIL